MSLIVQKSGDADVSRLASSLGSKVDKIRPIVQGLSSAFWECAKVKQIRAKKLKCNHYLVTKLQLLTLASTYCTSSPQLRVPEDVFVQAISQLSLIPEANGVLREVYAANYGGIVATTTAFGMNLPEYQHLDWRVDVEVGRRTLSAAADPKFMVRSWRLGHQPVAPPCCCNHVLRAACTR